MSTSLATDKVLKSPKYLVCVDARIESRVALKLACMKAIERKGTVDILHVVSPADFQTLGAIADRMKEERRQEGEALLKQLADEASAEHGITPGMILREGITGDEIVAAAMDDHDIIMLVMGIALQSNSRGKLMAWLASQLGHKLLTPILMVPGNLTDQQLSSLV